MTSSGGFCPSGPNRKSSNGSSTKSSSGPIHNSTCDDVCQPCWFIAQITGSTTNNAVGATSPTSHRCRFLSRHCCATGSTPLSTVDVTRNLLLETHITNEVYSRADFVVCLDRGLWFVKPVCVKPRCAKPGAASPLVGRPQ